MNEHNKISFIEKTNLFLVQYIIIWSLMPAFRSFINQGFTKILIVVVVIMWYLTAFVISNKWHSKIFVLSLLTISYFAIMIVNILFSNGDVGLSAIVNPLFLLLCTHIGFFYISNGNILVLKKIVNFSLVIILITTVTTTLALQDDVNVSRLVTSSSTSVTLKKFLEYRNVAGFDFIYGLILIFPTYIYLLLQGEKKSLGVSTYLLISLSFFFSLVMIYFANYMIAYLFTFISLYISLIPKKNQAKLQWIIFIFISLLFSGVLYLVLMFVLNYIRERTPSILMRIKIDGIINVVSGNSSLSTLTLRLNNFDNSIASFISAPFFGIGAFYNGGTSNIGSHAQFIDDFGRYGLFGAIPLLSFLFLFTIDVKNRIVSNKLKTTYILSVILFFLFNFLNPTQTYGVSILFFMINPIILFYVDHNIKGGYINNENNVPIGYTPK